MPLFKKKPVIIEAMQLPSEGIDASEELTDFLHDMEEEWEGDEEGIIIKTLEGDLRADPLDWIIKGIEGEYYPCKPHIFAATYEPVQEPDKELNI